MAEENWSNERCEHLINMYRESPNLWNPKHKDYKHRDKRQDSLTYIGEQLSVSKEEIERKSKNLTCQFWRENKKINSKRSGDGVDDTYSSKWFAYEWFAFLKDKNECRPSRNTDNVEEKGNTNEISFSDENLSNTSFQTTISSQSTSTDRSSLPQNVLNTSYQKFSTINKGTKRKALPKDEVGEKIIDMVRNIYDNKTTRDEYVIFGNEVATGVKKLKTDYARNTVKFKIQALLYEASLGYYDQPPNIVNYPSIPNEHTISNISANSFPNTSTSSETVLNIEDQHFLTI